MEIFKHTQIGYLHQDYCEDYALYADLDQNKVLLAVLDGCTMGTESYFASALIGKILRKIARNEFYIAFAQPQQLSCRGLLKKIYHKLFLQLKTVKNELQLDKYELLSTVCIAVVDLQERVASSLFIGDGLLCVNSTSHIFDQQNQPDYLSYHLNKDFDEWYNQQEQFTHFKEVRDISLSTDGIFTFSKTNQDNKQQIEDEQIINLLLNDSSDIDNERMLLKKITFLEKEYALKSTDDLGIVRLIF